MVVIEENIERAPENHLTVPVASTSHSNSEEPIEVDRTFLDLLNQTIDTRQLPTELKQLMTQQRPVNEETHAVSSTESNANVSSSEPWICSIYLPDESAQMKPFSTTAVQNWEPKCALNFKVKTTDEPRMAHEFDLREAGLLSLKKGEKLKVVQLYMSPRFLVQNENGEYGLVRFEDLKQFQGASKKRVMSKRCTII